MQSIPVRLFLLQILGCVLVGSFALVSQASVLDDSPGKRVLVIASDRQEIYLDTQEAMLDRIGHDIRYTEILADEFNHKLADKTADLQTFDLIVSIGSKATELSANLPVNIPVISLLLPREKLLSLRKKTGEPNLKFPVVGIHVDQPVDRQFLLAKALFPATLSVGTLLPANQSGQSDPLRAAALDQGLELDMVFTDDSESPIEAIKQLLVSNRLMLLFPNSATLDPQTAKWLLYMSYKKRTPVISFSRAYVQAGAIAAVFSTPQDIGLQAAEVIQRWVDTGEFPKKDVQPPRYFSVELNTTVIRALRLDALYNRDPAEIADRIKILERHE